MITTNDQESLFKLIADYIDEDIDCVAIGGTAMMFMGYKNTTKDIDLVFKNKKDRDTFIKAIEKLGYSKSPYKFVYANKKTESKNKPLIYSRGQERFDIFIENVFGFKIEFNSSLITQRRDFIGEKEIIVYVLDKEHLILLKSITNREKDLEDIETILKIEPLIKWEEIINLAIAQRKNDPWILIDLEEKMQHLKNKFFIKQEHFDRIYKEEHKHHK